MYSTVKTCDPTTIQMQALQSTKARAESFPCNTVKSSTEALQTISQEEAEIFMDSTGEQIGSENKKTKLQACLECLKGLSTPTKVALGVTGTILGLGAIASLSYAAARLTTNEISNSTSNRYTDNTFDMLVNSTDTTNQGIINTASTTTKSTITQSTSSKGATAKSTTIKSKSTSTKNTSSKGATAKSTTAIGTTSKSDPLPAGSMRAYITKPENCKDNIHVFHGDYVAHTFQCKDFSESGVCELDIGKMKEGKQIKVAFGNKEITHKFDLSKPYITFDIPKNTTTPSAHKSKNNDCYVSLPQICDQYRTELDMSHHCEGKEVEILATWGLSPKYESFVLAEYHSAIDKKKCFNTPKDAVNFSKASGFGRDIIEILYPEGDEGIYPNLSHNLDGQVRITTSCENGKPIVSFTNTGTCETPSDYVECTLDI